MYKAQGKPYTIKSFSHIDSVIYMVIVHFTV